MKLGIVGTGNVAYRHFEELSKIDGVKVEAICDVNSDNLNLFTKNYTIISFNIPGNGFDGFYFDNYNDFNTSDIEIGRAHV